MNKKRRFVMGKIVAIGGGCADEKGNNLIYKAICDLCGKDNPRMLYLPTAAHDDDGDFELLKQKFGAFGCETHELLLTDTTLTQEQIRDAILGCDIVYAEGGNLKFLMDTWTATNADKYLIEAFKKGAVLSGTSSGAMCWFERGYDDCGVNGEFIFIDCLGLLPYCNCPHFDNKNWRKFRKAVKRQDLPGIAVENAAAFIECNGTKSVLQAQRGRSAYLLDSNKVFRMRNLKHQRNLKRVK